MSDADLIKQLGGDRANARSSKAREGVPGKSTNTQRLSPGSNGPYSEPTLGAKAPSEKKKSAGFSKSGGGTVRDALTRLANAGKLKISPHQIAQLDALAQVETGGQVASVDTTDDMVVSIGFHQVVLGHKSVEWVIQKAPAAFAKHGIVLDMSKTYDVKGWSNPHRIKGVDDPDELRGHEWGDRFYAASLEDEVIVAIAQWALKEAAEVEHKTTKAGADNSFWEDDTARTWILEVDNNRSAYTSPAVKKAVALGANKAKDRDAFLDILSAAIVATYEELEPKLVGYPALKRKYPGKDEATLRAEALAKYKPIGHKKGTNIVTKISRHLKVPTLEASSVAANKDAKASPAPAKEPQIAAKPEVAHPQVAASEPPAAEPTTNEAAAKQPAAAPENDVASPHTFQGPAHLRVTASALNVRSSPTTHDEANILGRLRHGSTIEAHDRSGEWIAISYNSQRAYVHGGFVEAVPAQVEDAKQVADKPQAAAPKPATAGATSPAPSGASHSEPNQQSHASSHHADKSEPDHATHDPTAHLTPRTAGAASSDRKHASSPKPAQTQHSAPAPKPAEPTKEVAHAMDELVRGHYRTLVVMVTQGLLPLPVAVEQLLEFDRRVHSGHMSATGIELAAAFPRAVSQGPTATATAPDVAAAKKPTATQPAPAHGDAQAAAKPSSATTAAIAPTAAALSDKELLALGSRIRDPRMQALLEHIGGMQLEAKQAKKQTGGGNNAEYTNAQHRDALVDSIAVVRRELDQLDAKDPNVAAFKVAVYHEMQRIAPYHFQKNIRTIESWDKAKDKGGIRQWSTCNVTSLAMCLELVGISSRNFPREHESLLEQVAQVFEGDINEGKDDQGGKYAGAVLTAHGKGTSLAKLRGFRLPDFLELAAVVYATVSGRYSHDQKGITQGASDAVNKKSTLPFLKGLAAFMGGSGRDANVSFTGNDVKDVTARTKLRAFGIAHRKGVERMNTQRNVMENAHAKEENATTDRERKRWAKAHGDAQAEYTKLDRTEHQWLDDAKIEAIVPIESYKNAVTSQLGPHLDAGKGVIAGLAGHYVRLYAITPDHVCVQDPGQWSRTEMRITWAEARAMGYFWTNLVISS